MFVMINILEIYKSFWIQWMWCNKLRVIQMNEFISCITIRQSQIWCLLCTDISIHNKSYHLETPHFFDEIWCSPFFFPHLEWLIFAQDLYLHFKTTSFYGKHFDLIICLYFHKILLHHLLLIRLNNGKCKNKKDFS